MKIFLLSLAINNIGDRYLNGINCIKNEKNAFELFEKAANLGDKNG